MQEEWPVTEIRFSNASLVDLANIEEYTTITWGIEQTNRYLKQLESRLYWLAEQPQRGRRRGEIAEGLFSFPEGRHMIYYRAYDGVMEVARILHCNMDVDQQL